LTSRPALKREGRRRLILLVTGLIAAGFLASRFLPPKVVADNLTPGDELAQALAGGRPALVFFHSMSCEPCLQAIRTVEQVVPEYAQAVTLVDVNVSDTSTHDLLRRTGIRAIPAFAFYDRDGESTLYYGALSKEYLKQLLDGLSREGG
jgi:thiol-disulfide isomerase/thioredoxin